MPTRSSSNSTLLAWKDGPQYPEVGFWIWCLALEGCSAAADKHPSWIDVTERQRSKEQGTDRYSERVLCLSLEPLPCFCVPRIRYVSAGLLSLVTLKVMKYHAAGKKHCEDFCLRRCTPCNITAVSHSYPNRVFFFLS